MWEPREAGCKDISPPELELPVVNLSPLEVKQSIWSSTKQLQPLSGSSQRTEL